MIFLSFFFVEPIPYLAKFYFWPSPLVLLCIYIYICPSTNAQTQIWHWLQDFCRRLFVPNRDYLRYLLISQNFATGAIVLHGTTLPYCPAFSSLFARHMSTENGQDDCNEVDDSLPRYLFLFVPSFGFVEEVLSQFATLEGAIERLCRDQPNDTLIAFTSRVHRRDPEVYCLRIELSFPRFFSRIVFSCMNDDEEGERIPSASALRDKGYRLVREKTIDGHLAYRLLHPVQDVIELAARDPSSKGWKTIAPDVSSPLVRQERLERPSVKTESTAQAQGPPKPSKSQLRSSLSRLLATKEDEYPVFHLTMLYKQPLRETEATITRLLDEATLDFSTDCWRISARRDKQQRRLLVAQSFHFRTAGWWSSKDHGHLQICHVPDAGQTEDLCIRPSHLGLMFDLEAIQRTLVGRFYPSPSLPSCNRLGDLERSGDDDKDEARNPSVTTTLDEKEDDN